MSEAFSEFVVGEAALGWLDGLGWRVARGRDVAPDAHNSERDDYGKVVLGRRLRDTTERPSGARLRRVRRQSTRRHRACPDRKQEGRARAHVRVTDQRSPIAETRRVEVPDSRSLITRQPQRSA